MSNKELIEFFKNLPYKTILICIAVILFVSLIVKLINKSNILHIPKEKVRTFFFAIEFVSIFLFLYLFTILKITSSLIVIIIAIFEFYNFNIIYSYFLEKAPNFKTKFLSFFVALFVALIPSVVFTFVIKEISILFI